jgi:hypothetical protein
MRVRTLLAICLFGALAGACASAPLAPKGGIVDPASLDQGNLIAYRSLSREDFQATSPPADASPYAKRIGALTCARVVTTPDTSYRVREDRQGDSVTYTGSFQVLAFRALMDRNCSWWNPESSGLPEAYVLQHEQIHFALVELEARRLNAHAPAVIRDFIVQGSAQDEVKQAIDSKLQELMQRAVDDLLEINTEFDEATSAKHAPAVQQQWFDRVQADLGASGDQP